MTLEAKVMEEVKRKGINMKAISRGSGVPYSCLQPSLKGRRQLRADEFFAVCAFLNADPSIFKPDNDRAS